MSDAESSRWESRKQPKSKCYLLRTWTKKVSAENSEVLISEEFNLKPFSCLTSKSGKYLWLTNFYMLEIHSYLWASYRKSYWLHDKLSPLTTIYNAFLEMCEKGMSFCRVVRYHARTNHCRPSYWLNEDTEIFMVSWLWRFMDTIKLFYVLRFEMNIPWVWLLLNPLFDRSVKLHNKDILSWC